MPYYIFEHPETGEITEVFQKMNDIHEYMKDGIIWKRVFQNPEISIDSKPIDPFDSKAFVDKTRNKSTTLGNLQDLSSELSEKRAKIAGKDPLKEKKFEEYSKIRGGKEHLQKKKEKLKEALKGNKHFEMA